MNSRIDPLFNFFEPIEPLSLCRTFSTFWRLYGWRAKLHAVAQTFYLPLRFTRLPDMPLRVRLRGVFPRVPLLAIVGSRRPTKTALASIPWIVDAAVSSGWGILSGGARGIDVEAHRECLKRCGVTVAILGSGLSCLYPPEHAGLFRKIVEQGGGRSQ